MFIIKHKTLFVSISAALVGLAVVLLLVFGLRVGIDFKGGSEEQISYTGAVPSQEEIQKDLSPLGLGSALVQSTGADGYIIKLRDLTDAEHTSMLSALSENGKYAVN